MSSVMSRGGGAKRRGSAGGNRERFILCCPETPLTVFCPYLQFI